MQGEHNQTVDKQCCLSTNTPILMNTNVSTMQIACHRQDCQRIHRVFSSLSHVGMLAAATTNKQRQADVQDIMWTSKPLSLRRFVNTLEDFFLGQQTDELCTQCVRMQRTSIHIPHRPLSCMRQHTKHHQRKY